MRVRFYARRYGGLPALRLSSGLESLKNRLKQTEIKRAVPLFLLLFIFLQSISAGIIHAKHQSPDSGSADIVNKINSDDVTIYYCLNDSHSRNWARESGDGDIGITYFERFENSEPEGILLYQTIHTDGSVTIDTVTTGTRLEKSVLLFDVLNKPHIFVAQSDDTDQFIDHYFKNSDAGWQSETIIHFFSEGGKFIYELSAERSPDYSFHLLVLKTRSDIDSDDYNWAWLDSYLYHITNETGSWQKELIKNYDMAFTYDTYIKSSSRQDIKIDTDGHLHITFSEQINAQDDPSRLWYATNKSGSWQFEIALNHDYGIRDDAGWFPSLCLDNNEIPHISCMYVKRCYTYSAQYCKLFLLKRMGENNWTRTTIADHDDGYYGGDGRDYTGGLTHLVFDENNTPHIIFSDIASTHWPPPENQCVNMGNIRYGIFEDGVWNLTTIYRQPLPTRFYIATEMYGMCLIVSELTNTIRVIGQEMVITDDNEYSCNMLDFSWARTDTNPDIPFSRYTLHQNYPNPFDSITTIPYELSRSTEVDISIFNVIGQKVNVLETGFHTSGSHVVEWDGKDILGRSVKSGLYVCRMRADQFHESSKIMLIK